MPDWTKADRKHMQRALTLAARGQGCVEPNPMVGCVIVKRGKVVGEGYHRRFGGPHAERNALREVGGEARGATIYVTLEPCSHVGKTPPCADALVRAGVRRVVAAVRDPNPLVAGRGLRKLRTAGIRVDVGLLRGEASRLLAPFVTVHRQGRPYVILKWAQSIDGKIATRTGDSRWITSRASRRAAHALRARVDVIVVGIGTVLADDPALTARHIRPRRTATRIILDKSLRTPLSATVVTTARQTPTLIVAADATRKEQSALAARRRRLEKAGCEVIAIASDRRGVNLQDLLGLLRQREMTNLLVEGGGRVIGSFLDEGLADEAAVFVAPTLIGGETAPGPLRGRGPKTMVDLIGILEIEASPVGPDICYTARFGERR